MKVALDFEGLDDLKKDFIRVRDSYPDETAREIYRLAGVFTKDVDDKMPAEYAAHNAAAKAARKKAGQEGKTKPKNSTIQGSWKRTKVYGMGGRGATVAVEVENTAPHWHLVENGHTVRADPAMAAAYLNGRIDHGKSTKKYASKSRSRNPKLRDLGWAPGKGYCEKTRDEWNNGEFADHIGEYVDRMLEAHNL